MDKVKLEEKFVITRNSIKPNSPDYNKEVQSALERTKYLFPQLCLLADPVLTFIRENPVGYSNSKPIESTSFDLQQYRFELYPKDESAAFHLLKTINSQITRPLILDFLLHVNYLHDTFPSLLPSLNELYFHIYTENKIPIIQLALISHLFSISPVNVYELSRIYEPQKINHPGKVVSCILTTDNRILPL